MRQGSRLHGLRLVLSGRRLVVWLCLDRRLDAGGALGGGLLDLLLALASVVAKALGDLGHARLYGRRGLAAELLLDARGDHGDADNALERIIARGAEDHVGVLVHFLADAGRRLVDFIQGEV